MLSEVAVRRQAVLVVFLNDGGSLITDSESAVGKIRCRVCWFLFVLDSSSVLSTHAQENLAGRLFYVWLRCRKGRTSPLSQAMVFIFVG